MNYYKNLFLLVLFLNLLFQAVLPQSDSLEYKPKVINGVIDLSDWDYHNKGTTKLDGKWEFYWNQLLTPEDFKDTNLIVDKTHIKVPDTWTNSMVDSVKLPYEGYVTYRLRIILDSIHSSYGLKINDVFSNYKIWINDKYYGETGKVGTIKTEAIPKFYSKEYPIHIDLDDSIKLNRQVEIIIQASNYHHLKAGIKFPVHFGTLKTIFQNVKNAYVLNLIIVGILFIIGLNHLIHYILRRKDPSNLYFGILCTVMILRNITTNDRVLSYWFPEMNWHLLVKLDNFSGFGTIALFALFLYVLFKSDFPKLAVYILVTIGAIIALIIFTTPITFFIKYQTFYELYVLGGGLYLTFYILLRASFRGREGAFITFIGFIVLYGTAINDVLSNMGITEGAYLAPYGVVFYMIIQSFILNRRSAYALKENEKLSDALNNEKQNLESNIKERTDELFLQNRELIKLRRKEQRRNWYNERYASLSDILNKEKDNTEILVEKLLSALIKHLEAQMGLMYIVNIKKENEVLDLKAVYGADKESLSKKEIISGEGTIGACFKNNKSIIYSDMPENYIKIGSGMGESKPYSLALIPMRLNEKAFGVLEIGSFKKIQDYELELIERIAANLASTINTARINQKSSGMISKFTDMEIDLKQKEIQLQKQEEEIQVLKEKLKKK
ncbi:7TM diverse intracellular signaling domain-containing protein [Bacteroidota bacterium]